MSKRSDRAAGRKAVKQAEKDMKKARDSARKAFDLKDPRFLGEAAVAATRGPVGLALFGASRGLQAVRDRRAEQAEILGDLAADAKQHAEALREQTSALASPPEKRSPVRRFAPLWIAGLAGGAAIAGVTAYFLRDPGPSSTAPSAAPTPPATPAPASAPGADTVSGTGPGAGSAPQPAGAETGEDLTIDSADPEGPAGQDAATTPAAESAAPGAGAGSAPQPSDEAPENGTANDK